LTSILYRKATLKQPHSKNTKRTTLMQDYYTSVPWLN